MHSYDRVPASTCLTYGQTIPASGGDTVFASMYAAYDALSDGMKCTLAELSAVHANQHVFGSGAKRDPGAVSHFDNPDKAQHEAVHPLVINHPLSGRKALYLNPLMMVRIDGWTARESESLLSFLNQHMARFEFGYRFCWRSGSLAIWDNRATCQCEVNDISGEERVLHRIVIQGEALSGEPSSP